MPAPPKVLQLVERFKRNADEYRDPAFNEANLRIQFIDPMFKELGWDMANEQGHAEAYKEVVHEAALKIGEETKAPDYCFRIGGTPKFYLEAKKPAVNIKDDPSPAYQLRRYAWSAKFPLSILTDFEEFAIYDGRVKPSQSDKASAARIVYMRYSDYAEKWNEIADVFAREAILRGSFDKYADAKKGKRGTATVDSAFLEEIEGWREELAKNFALRNPKLSSRELNYAVQITIDRIIFLRMCEDRGIEPYGQLRDLTDVKGIYGGLFSLFRNADDRYNSGLFHFESEKGRPEGHDELTPRLKLDDKVLKTLLRGLYYPESPYVFSKIPTEILGQVYEQFLGKVIRLTGGHQAKVEEKPEVKKAGGVYYTPTYIVDYIVKHTVGNLLEDKTPKQASKLRILDPACGSGSFLLGAYQYLLDWHLQQYRLGDPEKLEEELFKDAQGEWHLTTQEKKRILLNNIYGVDIDSQAVEVTKLSLLLKVLEGETKETINQQRRLFHGERVLPDLASNIKCGNSLIGPDFYDEPTQGELFEDEEERIRINVFDWNAGFPAIMKAGGFDAVIGNPPYVLLQDEFRDDKQLAHFRRKYAVASFKLDTYHLFIERGIRLTSPRGKCSMITPANFLTNNYLVGLRRFMIDKSRIDHVLVIDGGVFAGVSVDNAVFVVDGGSATQGDFQVVRALPELQSLTVTSYASVSAEKVLADEHALFTGTTGGVATILWKRVLSRSKLLGEIAFVNFGKQLRDRKKFTKDVIEVSSARSVPSTYKPCYTGRDVLRYELRWGQLACLDDTVAQSGGCWDDDRQNAKNKILTRQIGKNPEFALDTLGYQCLNTMFMISAKDPSWSSAFLIGLLNSSLIRAYWTERFYDLRRTFPKIKGTYLKQLPIYAVNLAEQEDKERHDRMVQLVDRILSLHKQLASAKTPHDQTSLQSQIAATDRQIDALVYELYGLSDAEIKIVGGEATK